MEPSKFERAKVGAMMGGAVGLCIGFVFGGFSIMRNGPGSRGYVDTLAKTMLSSTAMFSFFMAIGSVIRSEEALAIEYRDLDRNRGKTNIWGQPMAFRTPPVVILQKIQQQKTQHIARTQRPFAPPFTSLAPRHSHSSVSSSGPSSLLSLSFDCQTQPSRQYSQKATAGEPPVIKHAPASESVPTPRYFDRSWSCHNRRRKTHQRERTQQQQHQQHTSTQPTQSIRKVRHPPSLFFSLWSFSSYSHPHPLFSTVASNPPSRSASTTSSSSSSSAAVSSAASQPLSSTVVAVPVVTPRSRRPTRLASQVAELDALAQHQEDNYNHIHNHSHSHNHLHFPLPISPSSTPSSSKRIRLAESPPALSTISSPSSISTMKPETETRSHNGTVHPDGTNGCDPDLHMSSSSEYALELSTTTPLGFNRLELVRLMVQSLQGLGYHQAAQALEAESGYQLESPAVSRFRECVLSGNWTEVEQLTNQLNLDINHGMANVKFLIREQKFLELLEARQIKSALVVLRSELTPLNQNMDRVHALTSYMMSSSPEDLRQRAGWDGVEGQSRQKLLTALQKLISPAIMVPENRLENMLQQAVELQVNNCLYHDIRNDIRSLYSDHVCDKTGIPSVTRKVLEEHTNEVWYVSFSHDGRFLASASADSRIIVWNVQTYEPVYILQGHTNKVSCCAWSPDDTKILSTGLDRTVKLWDVQTETLLKSFQKHSETINCLAWLPEGDRFVSGCEKKMLLMNDQGDVRYTWPFPVRDVAVSPDGRTLIAMGGTIIRIISLDDMSELNKLEESDSITAISLSRDGRYLLANTTAKPAHPPQQREIHLWNLEEGRIERRYVGHKQGRYIIRSCFGGWGDRFVISGSEDSSIYIWHRDNGSLVQTLEGHQRPVTCVAWNPIHPTMLVSASDDNTIRIWGTPEDARTDQGLLVNGTSNTVA